MLKPPVCKVQFQQEHVSEYKRGKTPQFLSMNYQVTMQKPGQVLNVFLKSTLQQQMEDALSSHSNLHSPYSVILPQDLLMAN